METNAVIVRYGEIGLKGKNRTFFERRLQKDIRGFLKLSDIPCKAISRKRGRIYIRGVETLPDLKKVLGVYSYSPALEIQKDMKTLTDTIKNWIPKVKGAKSFRVSCQRVDKQFSIHSVEIERQMGEILFEATRTPVNLKQPDLEVQIEVGEDFMYVFSDKIKGYAGMPIGTAGKLVSLISGGIDSPVATFLMMKRGVEPILLHFKITDDDAAKVAQLKDKLEKYTAGRKLKLHIIDRDALFEGKFSSLYDNPRFHPYMCIFCKYMMHKKAGEIAEAEGAHGLITGDNLAQVASQTLKNLQAYRMMSGFPVYSPLISFEKQTTMQIAKEIGTYDLSTEKSYGCTPPKSPKTGVKEEEFINILKDAGLG